MKKSGAPCRFDKNMEKVYTLLLSTAMLTRPVDHQWNHILSHVSGVALSLILHFLAQNRLVYNPIFVLAECVTLILLLAVPTHRNVAALFAVDCQVPKLYRTSCFCSS